MELFDLYGVLQMILHMHIFCSVVFAGFSADALRDRILDADCRLVITADQGKRGGKVIHLKKIADEAVAQCPNVSTVIVFQRTGDGSVPFYEGRDVWWHEQVVSILGLFY
jgi:acetyl-CoA synthetase